MLAYSFKLPPPVLSLTLRSALLGGAKAPVVANIAYYAMSLLSKRESIIIPPLEEEVDSKNEVF